MARDVVLTYDQQVLYVAESIGGDFSVGRKIAIASAAYALSLAHSKAVAVVTADLEAAMAAQKEQS